MHNIRCTASSSFDTDALLTEASASSNKYERRMSALSAFGIYGAGPYLWQLTLLVDGGVAADLGASPADMVLSRTAIFAAWGPGSVVLGSIADKLGRKPTLLFSLALGVTSLVASANANDFGAFVSARALSGVALGGYEAVCFTLLVEGVTKSRASAAATALNSLSALTICSMVPFHIACTELFDLGWREELLAVGAYQALALGATALLAIESPSFLAETGRQREAAAAIRRVAAINKADLSPAAEACLAGAEEERLVDAYQLSANGDAAASDDVDADTTAMEALFGGGRWRSTLAISFGFVACVLNYYALACLSGGLSDAPNAIYVTLPLLALVDVPGYVLADWAARRAEDPDPPFSLRTATSGALVLSGGLCLLIALVAVTSEGGVGGGGAAVALAVGAKLLVAAPFQTLYLLPILYYPARFRGTGIGFCLTCGRLASTASPFIAGTLPLQEVGLISAAVAFAAGAALAAAPPPPVRATDSEATIR